MLDGAAKIGAMTKAAAEYGMPAIAVTDHGNTFAAFEFYNAAKAAGIKRYVMVSYLGAKPDHGVPEDNSFFAYAEAKAAADTYLRSSGLDWTIVMPSSLTLEPARGIDLNPTEGGSASREAVAQVIVEAVDNPSTIGADLPFNDGDTPVADALG